MNVACGKVSSIPVPKHFQDLELRKINKFDRTEKLFSCL